jgi:hypothetical protein
LWKENTEQKVGFNEDKSLYVHSENVRKTSSRNKKKTPIHRNKVFLKGNSNFCTNDHIVKNDLPQNKVKQNVSNMNKLTIMHQNIRSRRNKINEFIISLSDIKPHLECFPEHHIKDMEHNTPSIPTYKLGATYSRNILKWGCMYLYK